LAGFDFSIVEQSEGVGLSALRAPHVDDIRVGRSAGSQKDYTERSNNDENEHDDNWRKAPLRRW
jgi:hypothetical protein